MASTTSQYAAGDMSHYALGGESRKISGKRRRTVYSTSQRPLFVAEAEFRPSKVFTRVKKGMLALYGTVLHVVDVLGLEAADVGSSGTTDVTSHVLRWVNYVDLLDVSFAGPTTLKIEHGDTSDRPKVRGINDSFAGQTDDDSSSHSGQHAASAGGSIATMVTTGAPAAATGSAAIRVTADSFTLTFRDPSIAQQAAAALLFQQAQYAAVCHWLRMGLHAGLRCDLISISALPLLFDDQQNSSSTSGSGSGSGSGQGGRVLSRSHSLLPPHVLYSAASGLLPRASLSGAGSSAGSAGGPAAATAAARAYPWGDAAAGAPSWGCSLPLPASWGPVLDAAASSSDDNVSGDGPAATPEELTCPVALQHGPKALQVTISTPLGAAVATITPQLAKAALQYSNCREVLALPLHATSPHRSTSPLAAFNWSVQGTVSVASGQESSTASNTPRASNFDADDGVASVGGASSTSSVGLSLTQTLDAFAALTVHVVRTPSTAGTAVSRPSDKPWAQGRAAAGAEGPATAGQSAGQYGTTAAAEPAGNASSGGSSSWQSNLGLQLQLAVCAVLAAMAFKQFSGQLLMLLMQLLLLAALALAAVKGATSTPTNSSSSRHTVQQQQQKQLAAAAGSGVGQADSSSSSEDVRCCGWSILLVSADLCSAPSRHLQLQVSLARASRDMARLRLRMASMSTGGAALPLPLLIEPPVDEVTVPLLVSDPEPLWLNADTKERFINAKPTLDASREQARSTDQWRRSLDMDSVLMRPCPKFPLLLQLLPVYLLSNDSPEGHAVVLTRVGGVKDLCDAIFQAPEGAPGSLSLAEVEHALALLNEYMVQVAAPKPLPAGYQVQIYDLSGFKLSYVMGDMMALFKLLVRFGLYYPERLQMALVIHAPAWFSTPWKAMSVFLDENTSAKVVVVGNPKSALSTLAHHLGGLDNVPVAWGGKCSRSFEEYPSHVQMMNFGNALNAGEKPFLGLRKD